MNRTSSIKSTSRDVVEFLREERGLCSRCVSFVVADRGDCHSSPLLDSIDERLASSYSDDASDDEDDDDGVDDDDRCCTVCFGVSSSSYQRERVLPAIEESLRPYCRIEKQRGGDAPTRALISADEGNYLMRESPTVNLPWLIGVRARCAIASAKWYLANEAGPSARLGVRLRSAEEAYLRVKENLRSSLTDLILETLTASDDESDDETGDAESERVAFSQQLHEEEAGYLGIHVLILPPCLPNVDFSSDEDVGDAVTKLVPPSFRAHVQQHKQQIKQNHYRALNPRKRFRGNDPTLKQGGDPRFNLELRTRRSADRKGREDMTKCGELMHEWNATISWLEKNTVLDWLEDNSLGAGDEAGAENGSHGSNEGLSAWMRQLHRRSSQPKETEPKSSRQCSIHAATFRRPFHVRGTYTKSRRDVSQTPFYVAAPIKVSPCSNEDNNEEGRMKDGGRPSKLSKSHTAMVKKGVSSVEEEICPLLALIGCGGISRQNNERACSEGGESEKGGATVYGLCKFHASGREDIDVRMLLPPPSVVEACARSGVVITGRPFVCEIFDAHRMPSARDLEAVVRAVNFRDVATNSSESPCGGEKEIKTDEKGWPTTLVPPDRYHGANPRGVGVSSPLTLASSAAFSGLQSETEEKVKHYGCVCHTSVPIRSNEELLRKLGCSAWDGEGWEGEEGGDDGRNGKSPTYPLKIQQSTPLRVLHRRSSDVRLRYVLGLSARRMSDHWFRLRMSTSAGTYVKEFVHGDCGRTRPSIGSMLGGRTDITELDCEGIAL